MGREEQKEEREVLDAIFPDEITDISDTEYRISITLGTADQHGNDETNTEDPPSFLLHVSLPENYPDVPPNLDITPVPNAPKHTHLDLSHDKPALLSSLSSPISENLGMAMIFALVNTLKETAESLVASRLAQIQAGKDAEAAKAEEEENRKFQGEAVTKERFLAWRKRFRKEMEERRDREEEEREESEKKRNKGKLEERRLTGKELFQKGLAGKGVDEEEIAAEGEAEEEGELVEGVGKVGLDG